MMHPNSRYPHPGKYEGERMLLVLAHGYDLEGCASEWTGDACEWPFISIARVEMGDRYGDVYVATNEQGLVYETDEAHFRDVDRMMAEQSELDEAYEEAASQLRQLESEEAGLCDSCGACMINGIRAHEHGCPRYARLVTARENLANLEDY